MRVSKKTYDAVNAGDGHVQRLQAKKVKRDAPFTVTNIKTGEIQERAGLDAFKHKAVDENGNERIIGCPAPVGTVRDLRYIDKKTGNVGGDIQAIVTEAYPYNGNDGRPMWAIKWQKVGPHRRIPDTDGGVFLAPGRGYVASAKRSIDADASVIPDEEVRRVLDDERAAKAESRREKIAAVRRATEGMLGDDELERWAHRIRQELDKAERAA